jgi:hypothetical protein
MKNNLFRFGLLTLIVAGFAVSDAFAQDYYGCSYCGSVKLTAQSVPEELFPGTTYTFKTYNTFKRKFRVVIATRDDKGKLHPIYCDRVKPGECKELNYPMVTKVHTVYITYKYRNWTGIFWNNADSVKETNDKECDPLKPIKSKKSTRKFMDPVVIRRAIQGGTGGGGTATTTIDEK